MYELESREERQAQFNANVENCLKELQGRLARIENQLSSIENVLYGNGTLGLKTLLYMILAFVAVTLPADILAKLAF